MAHGRYLAKRWNQGNPSPKTRVGEKIFGIVLDQNGFPLEEGEVSGLYMQMEMENLSFVDLIPGSLSIIFGNCNSWQS